MGKRIDADYPEDLVGIAIESFLTQLSFPLRRFSVEPVSRSKERWLGADARLHSAIRGFRPFYMQFKKPTAYPHDSTSKIITDRRKAGLGTCPRALYFQLREKKPGQTVFQHNVLLRLRNHLVNRGLGDAAYVCPLFVDRSAYRRDLYWSGLARWPRFWHRSPWDLEELLLEDGGRTIRFDRIPLLVEHVTVPPHVVVTTAKHKYSFNESGGELCFHSPEALPDGSADLARFLARVANGFLDEGEKLSPRQSIEPLKELIEAVFGDGESRPEFDIDPNDPMGAWFAWGDHLRKHHAIEQFALMRWSDDVRLPF